MRSPQGFMSATPVIKNLIIINAIMFIFSILQPQLAAWLTLYIPGMQQYTGSGPHFEPYQIVTHMFMHANFMHILFNMFALWMVGSAVEQYWGPKKFLGYYLICGLIAGAAQIIWMSYQFNSAIQGASAAELSNLQLDPRGVLGASGAIAGVMMGFAMMFPNEKFFIIPIPFPIKAKYLVVIYLAFDIFGGIAGGDGIAHFAHAGGAIFGFLVCAYWKYRGSLYSHRI